MSGDYTRFTFAARKLFSGVLKQQGRVSLDADFNEFQDILDRRDRSEMYDTVGPAVVPDTTKDGFKIGVNAGQLTIGVGRMYVDGIQAECFGDMSKPPAPNPPAPTEYDAALGNLRGSNPLPFDAQPFVYTPSYPGIAGNGVIHMLYLDVWQREVTSWEDEGLLDKALAGVDTATRVQTAWQVKALANVAADACTNPPQSWLDLIAPSTARMTATASQVLLPPGPCVIQPAGGYTGLENRLYRVEVHEAGTLAGPKVATFKWSRDNASLVASVLSVTATPGGSVISVESIGRDAWTRLKIDDQIELLDDFVEFAMRDSNVSGRIAKVTNVNPATQQVTIDQDFSAFPIVDLQHPRIRRWDVEKAGDPPVRPVQNGMPIPLENGIQISFGDGTAADANKTLHAGDYWTFAARTADGSIEVVDNEPPQGILHHFAPLAIVTSGNPPTVDDDCRNPWPVPCDCEGGGGCECDQCVTQESHDSGALTIQDAVQKVIAAGGGTVCIGIGFFKLGERRIEIVDALSVQVRGRGVATVLEFFGNGPAIEIRDSIDIGVRDLSLITERHSDKPNNAIEIDTAALVRLERLNVIEDPLALLQFLNQGGLGRPIGGAVALGHFVLRTSIRDCNLAGGGGVVARSWASNDDKDYLVGVDLDIGHNLVLASNVGVALGTPGRGQPETVLLADGTTIHDNRIWGCRDAGIAVAGQVFGGDVQITSNVVGTLGHGTTLSTDRTTVADNTLISLGGDRPGHGVAVMRGHSDLVNDVWVRANRIDAFPQSGVQIDAAVTNLVVDANTISQCGYGIVMSEESKGETVRIAANRLSDIGRKGGGDDRIVFGIGLVFTTGGEVIDNTIAGVALEDTTARWRAGIQLIACRSGTVRGNTVSDVGPTEYRGVSVGIGATLGFERLDVLDNNVVQPPVREKFDSWALLIGVSREVWTGALVELGKEIWWVEPNNAFNLVSRDAPTEAAVRGNHLIAAAFTTPTAEVQTFGSCTFAENWCTLLVETELVPVVQLGLNDEFPLRAMALANNQVRRPEGGLKQPAVDAWVKTGAKYPPPGFVATVLGNITAGEIHVNNQQLQPLWLELNVIIP